MDDVRATNPPTNPELLDALAKCLVENKYDVKALIRTITASRVYQLSSKPNATNERDEQNYSRALFKRIDAEVLLDMVCQTTGVAERFDGMPAGTRAIQLWDSKASHYFLKVFGRPERVERLRVRAAHASRAWPRCCTCSTRPEIQAKLEPRRRLCGEAGEARRRRRIAGRGAVPDVLQPAADGRKNATTAVAYLRKAKDRRREAVEDLAWTLMNSLEFVFNH